MDDVQWAHRIAAEAVQAMAHDWYCPGDSSLRRRECVECVAQIAVNAVTGWLGAEGRLDGSEPYTISS